MSKGSGLYGPRAPKGFCPCGEQLIESNCPPTVFKKQRGQCRKCIAVRHAKYSKNNPDKVKAGRQNNRDKNREKNRAYEKAWYRKRKDENPDFYLPYHRKTVYGMTNEVFESLLKSQDNRCAICQKEFGDRTPCVDHNHDTKENRGLLCGNCNKGLGHFFENREALLSAVAYLKKYKNTNILE